MVRSVTRRTMLRSLAAVAGGAALVDAGAPRAAAGDMDPKVSASIRKGLDWVAREQARRAQLEKAERDRQLNKEQQAEAEKKAIRAQIVQLITMNRIHREGGDVAYQFKDGTRIKKLYVTPKIHGELVNGRLAIAKLADGYELLPAAAAQKIAQRFPNDEVW